MIQFDEHIFPLGASKIQQVGGGFKYFYFHPDPWGKWSNLTSIFQTGCFNHHLGNSGKWKVSDLTYILQMGWLNSPTIQK